MQKETVKSYKFCHSVCLLTSNDLRFKISLNLIHKNLSGIYGKLHVFFLLFLCVSVCTLKLQQFLLTSVINKK